MDFLSNLQNYFNPPPKNTMKKEEKLIIETSFKLPIEYLNEADIKEIPNHVSTDLELLNNPNPEEKNMYQLLFQPTNEFGEQLLHKWNNKYTTNTKFLQESQYLIQSMNQYRENMNNEEVNIHGITTLWKNTKKNNFFHEKYNYVDWDIIKHLNHSSLFLQILSCIHILSPIFSFIFPLLLLIFPFIILKIQGIPISVNLYVSTLKTVAKSHIIGKILTNAGSLDYQKLLYLCFYVGFYLLQIYQNINTCKSFYKNITLINEDILECRRFVQYSKRSIDNFICNSSNCSQYGGFNNELVYHQDILEKLENEMKHVTSFQVSLHKFSNMGNMLKIYYGLYSNKEYENTLQYCIGFEGYINNLSGLHNNICNKYLSFASYDSEKCTMKKQYYPAINHTKPIKNDVSLNKNMIISAPNKAGKTTILKSTLMNVIFSQQIGCGFYESCNMTPYSHIHSYLNIPDTSGRDSLFQAESRRCKEIIDSIQKSHTNNEKHFCIFDELYSGTNPEEAVKSANAFLKYLQTFSNVDFMLTTHYKKICKNFKKSGKIENYKMSVSINKDGSFNYNYQLKKGISNIKGGIRVLKDMEYPEEILKEFED